MSRQFVDWQFVEQIAWGPFGAENSWEAGECEENTMEPQRREERQDKKSENGNRRERQGHLGHSCVSFCQVLAKSRQSSGHLHNPPVPPGWELPLEQSENSKNNPKTEDTTTSIQGSRLLGIRPSYFRFECGRDARLPTMGLPGVRCDVVAAGVPARWGYRLSSF